MHITCETSIDKIMKDGVIKHDLPMEDKMGDREPDTYTYSLSNQEVKSLPKKNKIRVVIAGKKTRTKKRRNYRKKKYTQNANRKRMHM